MKVGFLINDLANGGAEQVTCGIAGYLAESGIDTTILTIKECIPFYDVDEKVKINSLSQDINIKKAGVKRVVISLKKSFGLRKKIKKYDFDVIIGMSDIMSYYVIFATMFTRTKCIGTERSDPDLGRNGKLHRILKRIAGRLADGFIFQTEKQRSFYSTPKCGQAVIIPNAIFNKYAYEAEIPSVREKTVTAMGRLVIDIKRYDDLIDAFLIFHKKFDDYTLNIFGQGEDKEKIQDYIDKLNANEYIKLCGSKKDAVLTASKSSAYVLSSRYEGLPNALLEALYCGIPCVSTDCSPAIKDLIKNGENGLIVPVGDVNGIADCLEKIVSDKAFSDNLSKNAVSSTRKYDIKNIGRIWVDYFNLVLNK